MRVSNRLALGLKRALSFGNGDAEKTFDSFFMKIILFMLPAVLLGYGIDATVDHLRTKKTLGNSYDTYITLQTVVIIIAMYLFVVLFESYAREFNTTLAGGFFLTMFFGFQMHYFNDLKHVLNRVFL
jgi:NO-binding membrane sensor protein with MHYT domain